MKLIFIILSLLSIIKCLNHTSARLTIPIERRESDFSAATPRYIGKNLLGQIQDQALMNAFKYNQTLKNYANTQYIGNVVMGSQNAVLSVVFDTGSDILWLPSTSCTSCHRSSRYNCAASTTCHTTSSANSRQYGTGLVSGYSSTEMIGLTADSKVKYPFLLAYRDASLENFLGDGIMGLSNDNSEKNFVDLAYEAGLIDDKVFSFYMDDNPVSVFVTTRSYMAVGYIPEQFINGAQWLAVTDSNYWSTDVIGMEVNGETIHFGSDPDVGAVLFDTGTSYMLIANNVYQKFLAQLLANRCVLQTNEYNKDTLMCPCATYSDYDTLPNITFYTRGAKFTITSHHYLILPQPTVPISCYVAIQNTYLPSGSIYKQILGDSFLRHNYVAFSKNNQSVAINAQHMHVLIPIEYKHTFWTGIICSILMAVVVVVVLRKPEPDFEKEDMLNVRLMQQMTYDQNQL